MPHFFLNIFMDCYIPCTVCSSLFRPFKLLVNVPLLDLDIYDSFFILFFILDFLFCTLIGTCDALSLVSNKGWEDNSSLQSFLGQINSFREADSSTGETQLGLIKCSKFHCDACKRWSGGCDKSKVISVKKLWYVSCKRKFTYTKTI